ncbi:hypothetical protein RMATCC62417_18529 [Rhizopus microsporus]|nr:hypothetical protein RMATCC62417_18529 [Rhizopus microsporus]
MQIKLVILTICASLAVIGFATPFPQGDPNANGSDSVIPVGEQIPPGFDDLGLPGGPDESTEDSTLGNLDDELMEALVRRRVSRGRHRRIRYRGHGRRHGRRGGRGSDRGRGRGRGRGRRGERKIIIIKQSKKKE